MFDMFLVIILGNFPVNAVEGPKEALKFLDMVYVYSL